MKKKTLSFFLVAAILTGTFFGGISATAIEERTNQGSPHTSFIVSTPDTIPTPIEGEEEPSVDNTTPTDDAEVNPEVVEKPTDNEGSSPTEEEGKPTDGEGSSPTEGEGKPTDGEGNSSAEGEGNPADGETTTPNNDEGSKPENTQNPNANPSTSVPMAELVPATPTAETLQTKAGTLTDVYLDDDSGDNTNDGKTADTAVKTFEKAKELLAENGTIWLRGTYDVSGSQTWSLADKGNAMVKRYRQGKDGTPIYTNMIELASDAELTLENIVIDGNKEEWKEGEYHNNSIIAGLKGGKLILNNGTVLQNNNASYMGAAVSGWDGFELIMNDGAVIRNNECHGHEYGGGVFVAQGTFIMNGGTISGNRANRGGGVAINDGSFEMYGGEIANNSTYLNIGSQPGYGGGVYLSSEEGYSGAPATDISGDVTFTMTGGSIHNNHAQGVGGGILTFPSGGYKVSLNISGGEITENFTEDSGGGICMYFTDSILNMTGGEISNNTAQKYGGGIYQYNTLDSTINGGRIINNTASYGGGVHLYFSSRLMLYSGEISDNTADFGGGVNIERNSLFYMNGGEVKRNTANMFGGGVNISFNSGRFHMIDGEIQGNQALLDGSSAGVNVGNVFELGGTAKIDPDNDVFLYSNSGKHIDMISTYTGTTGAEPIQITSNTKDIENTQIGTKLVLYKAEAGGEAAAAQADEDGIFVPSQYMEDGLMIGESQYEKEWMTYVEGVSVKYEWVSTDNPSDVTPPRTDKIKKGTEYTAKEQKKSSEGYAFDGWYIDKECTQKFVEKTKLDITTTLYGKWTKQSEIPLTPLTPATPIPNPSNPTDPTPDTPNRPVTPDRPVASEKDESEYILIEPTKTHPEEVEQEKPKEPEKNTIDKYNPETGSANHAVGAMVLAAVSLAGILTIRKKH